MAIFSKKTPLQELEAEQAALTRRRERLAGKTQAAQTELQRAAEEQIKLLTESDDDNAKAETNALRRVELATSTLKALEAALAKIEEQISAVQHRADQEREAIEHNSAADAIEKHALTFEKTVEPVLTALRAFSKAAGELDHVNFDVTAIARYAHKSASELEVAAALAITEIRGKAAAVRDGHDRITRRAAAPVPLPPPPAVVRLWTIKPVAWAQDGHGQIRIVDLNQQIDLSPTLAAKAISAAAAVPLGDPQFGQQRANFRASQGRGLPSLENCIRLDAEADEALGEEKSRPTTLDPVLRSLPGGPGGFEQIDRGGPFIVKTAAGNAAPEATT